MATVTQQPQQRHAHCQISWFWKVKGMSNMAYIRYIGNVVVTFRFAVLLWIVATVATHGSSLANITFWLGLIVGMVAIQTDAEMRGSSL
jgi:hypothetical protein